MALRDNIARLGKYLESNAWNAFIAFDPEHVPYNKHGWDVESSALKTTISYHCAGDAIQIELEETTQARKGGPYKTRTLSATLYRNDADLLRKFLAQMDDNQTIVRSYEQEHEQEQETLRKEQASAHA